MVAQRAGDAASALKGTQECRDTVAPMEVRTPPELPQKQRPSWKHWALGIAGLLLLILILQNLQQVRVDFLFIHARIPLIFALILAGALGALIGWAVPHIRRGRERD
jgi:uncharacterized integral membrane protein